MAYLAPSLVKARSEINAKWPKRDKRTDGWLGDKAHQKRRSEHNPDGKGCVHAIDVDKDGIDVKALLRELIGDPRVWYVVFNRRIWSRTHGWKARRYTGLNPHTGHVHVSIRLTSAAEKSVGHWFDLTPPHPAPHGHDAPGSRDLRKGMRGRDVTFVQKLIGPARTGGADGIFGDRTEAAVRWYQKRRGLAQTGVVGPRTWAKMGVKYK